MVQCRNTFVGHILYDQLYPNKLYFSLFPLILRNINYIGMFYKLTC